MRPTGSNWTKQSAASWNGHEQRWPVVGNGAAPGWTSWLDDPANGPQEEQARVKDDWGRAIADFEKEVAAINKEIAELNLKVPGLHFQRSSVDAASDVGRLTRTVK